MKNIFIKSKFIWLAALLISGFAFSAQAANPSSDVIAMRVLPNADHQSPISWYYENVDIKGAPQSVIVDGYEGVRDGRTVYINAANLDNSTTPATIYTNIYVLSYNQDAESDTQDIFGQILQYWKFNTELTASAGAGNCLPSSGQACDDATPCTGNFADSICDKGFCVKKCNLSADCSTGQYCDSAKARLVRDVKRLTDFVDMKTAFDNYNKKNGKYPPLPAGSYLPNKTISVWPSWNQTLGATLGYQLPGDPVNKLGPCSANFDAITCWDAVSRNFATDFNKPVMPAGSLAYVYILDSKTGRYKLCGNFETDYIGLPAINTCDAYVSQTPQDIPSIILGKWQSSEGPFKDYFAVDSPNVIDWSTLKLTANWADWAARGWQWAPGYTGLKVEDTGVKNQRAIVAQNVNLPSGKDYDLFNLTISVSDIYGNKGSNTGDIRICNAFTCQDKNAECGRLSDGCGGTLLCGDCASDLVCIDNKCIKL